MIIDVERSDRGTRVAARVVVLLQVVFSLVAMWEPPNLYDEGIYLSTARFVADGLIPYRDFYMPYGPGLPYADAVLIWAHLDYLAAHRLVWSVIRVAISLVLLRMASRRSLLPLGVAIVAVLLIAPIAPPYLAPILCTALAIDWLDRNPSNIGGALALLGVAVWFRWEYLAVLGAAVLLLLITESWRRRAVIAWGAVAGVVGLAPYAVLAGLGGIPGLRQTVEYGLNSYGRYRRLPYPWDAPVDLMRDVLAAEPGPFLDHSAELLGYLLAPLAVAVAIIARLRRENGRVLFSESAILVGLGWVAVSVYTLRVRPDSGHAPSLIAALGGLLLLLVPSGLRWVRTVSVVAMAAVALLLVPYVAGLVGPIVDGPTDVDALVAEGGKFIRPGDPLFVADEDNSITYLNAPFLYWAFAARPASPVTSFDPGYADQRSVQSDIVDRLCRVQPMVIRWNAPVGDELRGLHFSDLLDDFLGRSYRVVSRQGEFAILAPTGDRC